ncbi:MAG: family 43 glycosylhydrolase [Lachnospirales bacterium]
MPSFEYVPDGEPHVFGDRVYLYGSHDRFGGMNFCLNDYICYSANVNDLSDWKYEGVIFKANKDFRYINKNEDDRVFTLMYGYEDVDPSTVNEKGTHDLFAPDVVKGNDGKYYLYYCFDCLPQIGVAVCDTPAGEYEFLGLVKYSDGRVLGENEGDLFQFDPGVFVDDDKRIYLYSGNAPMIKEQPGDGLNSQVMELENDMITLKTNPKVLLPSLHVSSGTGFEGHEFFEASSIRKINNKYYLAYSSINSHELCYEISDYPDKEFKYGGTIVDIGNIYLNRLTEKEAVNCLGNTHGIEKINNKWYIFYHRQTNRTNFNRQACAEIIELNEDGSINQVEVTTQGLEGKALDGSLGFAFVLNKPSLTEICKFKEVFIRYAEV